MSDKAFLKLPRVLITEPLRSKLSDSAIVLYSYLSSLKIKILSPANGRDSARQI